MPVSGNATFPLLHLAIIASSRACAAPPLAAQAKNYALKAARLFDSSTGTVAQPGLVIGADGKVQSAGGTAIPGGATAVDLGDATLLRGFIDAHTHLTDDFDADYNGAQLLGAGKTGNTGMDLCILCVSASLRQKTASRQL